MRLAISDSIALERDCSLLVKDACSAQMAVEGWVESSEEAIPARRE